MKSTDKKHGKKKTYLTDKKLKVKKTKAKPEPVEEKKEPGMVGFWGSKGVEEHIKNKVGFLAEGCTFDYMPYPDDIRKSLKQFSRYDIVCRHKDGEVILHYKVNFDSSGRFVPDQIVDNIIALRSMKG